MKNGCNKYINCEENCELCEECLQKVKKTIESLKTTKKGEPRLRGIEWDIYYWIKVNKFMN